MEILAEDDDAGPITDVILGAARTGRIGDGKIWIIPVEAVVRVRTGEHGPGAL